MPRLSGTDEELVEWEDDAPTLEAKVDRLAAMIKAARHFVAFTGAGISTSAGIPDFRGPQGVWTLRDRGIKVNRALPAKLWPTKAHMALVALQNAGIMKYLVSQNTDGLHRFSGIAPDRLSELHGNGRIEACERCGAEYLREFRVRNAASVHEHRTGRACDNPACRGPLRDTIINFGEGLPEGALRRAEARCRQSDLVLVVGSSMRVTPACDLPRLAKQFVVVNLQATPADGAAALVVHGRSDRVLELLAARLALDVPAFVMRKRVHLRLRRLPGPGPAPADRLQVEVGGEVPYNFSGARVRAGGAGGRPLLDARLDAPPFRASFSVERGEAVRVAVALRPVAGRAGGPAEEPGVELEAPAGAGGLLAEVDFECRPGEGGACAWSARLAAPLRDLPAAPAAAGGAATCQKPAPRASRPAGRPSRSPPPSRA
eukprot:tig00000342_g24235.t1